MGGNRHGIARRHLNLLLTMLIGGLWHGASWTFVAWGGLHGIFLVVNHLYNGIRGRLLLPSTAIERLFNQAITVLAVLLAWVYFRAKTFTGAHRLFGDMFDVDGLSAASVLTYKNMASSLPGQFQRALIELGTAPGSEMVAVWGAFATGAAVIVFLLPNTFELFSHFNEAEMGVPKSLRTRSVLNFRWAPSIPWLFITVLALTVGILSMTHVAQFIYFEF